MCSVICIILLLQVPCKIVHVSRGCEVVEQIQALRDHFEHVGSPVMIGEFIRMLSDYKIIIIIVHFNIYMIIMWCI